MTDSSTRLLLLGAVSIFEPVNAYQLRRELLSWNVDQWAHVNPGSIYSGLATLVKQGHLIRHELEEGKRTVGVYQISETGQAEFTTLFDDAVLTFDQSSSLALYTALAHQGLVTREHFLDLLRRRRATLSVVVEQGERLVNRYDPAFPPNLPGITRLWHASARAELDWLDDTIARIGAGEGEFRGEPNKWVPAADDPGWVLARERERYCELLGLPHLAKKFH